MSEQARVHRTAPLPPRASASPVSAARHRAPAAAPAGSNQALQRALAAGALQAKLVVNEPGDQYEQEADRVADRVMRTTPADIPAGGAPPAGIQRACAACEEEERVQRKCASCEDEERVQRACSTCEDDSETAMRAVTGVVQRQDDPAAIAAAEQADAAEEEVDETDPCQTKRSPGTPSLSPDVEATIDSLRGTGSPLPPATRGFFEERLGYDFGGVRIHIGPQAHASTRSINALAYTVGRDVVFGAGQYSPHTDGGRRLLAHELTHVVQQTPVAARQAARVARRMDSRQPDERIAMTPATAIQRKEYYWAPNRRVGTQEHEKLLTAVSEKNPSVFAEVPAPATAKFAVGEGSIDLYQGSTTVGVYFPGHNRPATLEASDLHPTKQGGKTYDHAHNAAPYYSGYRMLRAGQAPAKILIGELKPPPDTEVALKGRQQIANYRQGFEKTAEYFQDFACTHPTSVDPPCRPVGLPTAQHCNTPPGAAPCWNPRVDYMTHVDVPPEYSEHGTGTSEPLVLKTAFGGWATLGLYKAHKTVFDPKGKVTGRLIMGDTANGGIFHYRYLPDQAVTVTPAKGGQLDRFQVDVDQKIIKKLEEPIRTAPQKLRRKMAPGTAVEPSPLGEVRDAAPVLQRRSPAPGTSVDGADPFDKQAYSDWKTTRKQLKADYKAALKSQADVQDAQSAEFAMDAYEDAKDKLNLKSDKLKPAVPTQAAARTSHKLRFWLGVPGFWIGAARFYLGRGVLKLITLFQKMKEGFKKLLKPSGGSSGLGSVVAAAGKALVRVAKLAASYLIERTFEALVQSLIEGVKNKVQQLLDSTELGDAFKKKFAEVRKLQCQLEQLITTWVDGFIKKFEPILNAFNALETVARTVTRIIDLVKWGIRVASCLSPPALGCLWILAQAAIEFVLQKVVESCWFQDELMPLVMGLGEKVKAIRDAPRNLARWIVDGINGILPGPLKGIFARIPEDAPDPKPADLECGDEESPEDIARRTELQQLINEVGIERYDALADLSREWGIRTNEPPTAEQIAAMRMEMRKHPDLTVGDLRTFKQQFPGAPENRPQKLVELGAFLDGVKANLDPETGALAATASAEAGAAGGASDAGTAAAPADLTARPAGPQSLTPKTLYPEVIAGLGAGVVQGARANVTLRMTVNGRGVSFPNLEYDVLGRTFTPSVDQPRTIEFKVRLTRDYYFTVTDEAGATLSSIGFYTGKPATVLVPYPNGIGTFGRGSAANPKT